MRGVETMRYIKKPKPQTGDKRTIKKFALLPIIINEEVRWLEFVTIYQEFIIGYGSTIWLNIKFIDQPLDTSKPHMI